MAVIKIYKYPHPLLREKCHPVKSWDAAFQKHIDDLIDTMYTASGSVGLSAPQVGLPIRAFAVDVAAKTSRDQLKVLINPVIVQQSRNKLVREGCLSFPEYLANIKRATRVTIEAFDREGQLVSYTVRDLEAIAMQHELDHLDGVLMIDRVTSLKTDWIRRQANPGQEHAGDEDDSSSGEPV